MSNIELLDSLHTKILHSKLAETITEQEIDAFIDYKEQMKKTYNQALEDFANALLNELEDLKQEFKNDKNIHEAIAVNIVIKRINQKLAEIEGE